MRNSNNILLKVATVFAVLFFALATFGCNKVTVTDPISSEQQSMISESESVVSDIPANTPTTEESLAPESDPESSEETTTAPTSIPTTTPTATPTKVPTSAPTATPTKPPTPTPTPTPATIDFQVSSVTASVSPESGPSICNKQTSFEFVFSGTITVTAAGTIQYKWVQSNGVESAGTLTFSSAGSKSVPANSWIVYGGSLFTGWGKIVVTSPNSISSNKANFTRLFCPIF